jgi:hypothetical protein
VEPIRFKPHHRAELLRLGLVPDAIDRVEVEALPAARELLTRAPLRGDVVNELRCVEKALLDAKNAIEKLLTATDQVPHRMAARMLLSGMGHRFTQGGRKLDQTSTSLTASMKVVAEAISKLPPGPNRHQAASSLPIKLIYSAVQFGSLKGGVDELPANLKPSSSPTSSFRKMIGICYECVDAPSADPERAIKAYVKRWRALEKHLESIGLLSTERPGKS